MLHDEGDEGELDVGWIGDGELLPSVLVLEPDGLVGEDGEGEGAFVTDDVDAVFLGGLVGHEAPGT